MFDIFHDNNLWLTFRLWNFTSEVLWYVSRFFILWKPNSIGCISTRYKQARKTSDFDQVSSQIGNMNLISNINNRNLKCVMVKDLSHWKLKIRTNDTWSWSAGSVWNQPDIYFLLLIGMIITLIFSTKE